MLKYSCFKKIVAIQSSVASSPWWKNAIRGLRETYHRMTYGEGAAVLHWTSLAVDFGISSILNPEEILSDIFSQAAGVLGPYIIVPALDGVAYVAKGVAGVRFEGLPGFSSNLVDSHFNALKAVNSGVPAIVSGVLSPKRLATRLCAATLVKYFHPDLFMVLGRSFAPEAVGGAVGSVLFSRHTLASQDEQLSPTCDVSITNASNGMQASMICDDAPFQLDCVIEMSDITGNSELNGMFCYLSSTNDFSAEHRGVSQLNSLLACMTGLASSVVMKSPLPALACLPFVSGHSRRESLKPVPKDRIYVICPPSKIRACDLYMGVRKMGFIGSPTWGSSGDMSVRGLAEFVHVKLLFRYVKQDDFDSFNKVLTGVLDRLFDHFYSSDYQSYLNGVIPGLMGSPQRDSKLLTFTDQLIDHSVLSVDVRSSVHDIVSQPLSTVEERSELFHRFLIRLSRRYFEHQRQFFSRSIWDQMRSMKGPSKLVSTLQRQVYNIEKEVVAADAFLYHYRADAWRSFQSVPEMKIVAGSTAGTHLDVFSRLIYLGELDRETGGALALRHEKQHYNDIFHNSQRCPNLYTPCDMKSGIPLDKEIVSTYAFEMGQYLPALSGEADIPVSLFLVIFGTTSYGDSDLHLLARISDLMRSIDELDDFHRAFEMMPRIMDRLRPLEFLILFPRLSIIRSRIMRDDGLFESELYKMLVQRDKSVVDFIHQHRHVFETGSYDGLSFRDIAFKYLPIWDQSLPKSGRSYRAQARVIRRKLKSGEPEREL